MVMTDAFTLKVTKYVFRVDLEMVSTMALIESRVCMRCGRVFNAYSYCPLQTELL